MRRSNRTGVALVLAIVSAMIFAPPAGAQEPFDWDLLRGIDWAQIPEPEPTYGGLTAAEWIALGEVIAAQPPAPVVVDPLPGYDWVPEVETAIANAAAEFGTDLTVLAEVVRCESGGNPRAQNASSSASGLTQFLDSTWAAFAPRLGYGTGREIQYDATANARVAAMVISEGGIGHWAPWSGSCSGVY